jgi:peptide/nickel transport system substrate-binding protein
MRGARGRFGGAVIVGAAAGCLSAACGPHAGSTASDPEASVLRVGVGQQAAASSPGQGLRQVVQIWTVENLATLSDEGRPRPWLAKDWTVAPDGLSLTVNLPPNVKFHDGSPLTATVVANALQAMLPNTMGPAFEDVEGVSAVSDQQVVVRFRRPSPFLLDSLETPIPKPGSSLVGTGSFVVVDPKSPTELTANTHYALGPPGIDRIVVQSFPSVRTAWAELLRGRLDMLYEVGIDALDSLETSTSVSVFTHTRHYQYMVVLNTESDAFRSKEIRRALNFAVDRNLVVRDALNGHGIASSGPIWPQNYGFRADLPKFEMDRRAAAAAFSRGTQSSNRAGSFHFTCLVPPDAVYERLALVLKQQLGAVGVDMSVEEAPMDRVFDAMKNRRFEAALIEGISAPTLLRPYQLWHSKGTFNPGGLGNATVDAAFDRVRHAATDKEYEQAVAGVQQAFMDDPPGVFLAWSVRARAVSKRFVVPPTESGRDIMATIRMWKPVTEVSRTGQN